MNAVVPAAVDGGREAGRQVASRLAGVDVARGLAILGMLDVHLSYAPDATSIAAGRASALFAVLAGGSLALLTGGARPTSGAARRRQRLSVLLRGLLLVAIGLGLWAIPGLPFAVILDTYGVLFVVLLPVLFARRRTLVALAACSAVAGAAAVQAASVLPPVDRLTDLPSAWFLTGEYPGLVFAAYLLMGMVAVRSDLARRRTLLRLALAGALMSVTGYGVAAAVPGLSAAPHSDTTWEVLGDGGVALVVVALLQLATTVGPVRALLAPVAALGAMPLSIYVLQVVAVLLLPISYASPAAFPVVTGASVVFAVLWRRWIGRGPLEELLARCTLRGRAQRTARSRRRSRRRRSSRTGADAAAPNTSP